MMCAHFWPTLLPLPLLLVLPAFVSATALRLVASYSTSSEAQSHLNR